MRGVRADLEADTRVAAGSGGRGRARRRLAEFPRLPLGGGAVALPLGESCPSPVCPAPTRLAAMLLPSDVARLVLGE